MGRIHRYAIPPRMLKRYLEDQIPPPPRLKAPPGVFKLRNVPPRIRRLQWQQQQQIRWIERQILPPVLEQFYCRRCCCSEFSSFQPALVGHSVMLQQWVLPEQRDVMLEEEEKKIENEEKKILEEEMTTVDYSRLTCFLEKDESFLTPWSWKPEANKRQSGADDAYFSFNVLERWAVKKKKKEIEPISTYVVV